jgi:hypothetical protein
MAPSSPKEVRRCGESIGGDERKNQLLLPNESKIWQILTLLRSEQAHTHGKERSHDDNKCLFFMGACANCSSNF